MERNTKAAVEATLLFVKVSEERDVSEVGF